VRTIRFTIGYDGTVYAGWQVQPGKRTIQGEIEKALTLILNEPCHLIGAGRTDAGVHALGQVAHIRVNARIPSESLKKGLNSILPKDISIIEAGDTAPDFHARRHAIAKRYEYKIYRGATRDPFLWPYTWYLPESLDIDKIRACLPLLQGKHDFSSFSVMDRDNKDAVREIKGLELVEEGDHLRFEFMGNGFLRKQIRRMVGTLIDTGRGRFTPEQVSEMLISMDPAKAGPTAPPQGLFLVKVYYSYAPLYLPE
jgi:tRNA pseudouridine38-40 synthase